MCFGEAVPVSSTKRIALDIMLAKPKKREIRTIFGLFLCVLLFAICPNMQMWIS